MALYGPNEFREFSVSLKTNISGYLILVAKCFHGLIEEYICCKNVNFKLPLALGFLEI